MDCDNTVFTGGAPLFPKGAPITIYSQRYSGQQTIPVQVRNIMREILKRSNIAFHCHILMLQAFASAWIPVRNLDFSHNLIRRLQDKIFNGIQVGDLSHFIFPIQLQWTNIFLNRQDTLSVLNLSDNLLGDSLNPIFSTAEFHVLSSLKNLDLSGNQIKGLEEGIFKGCDTLQVFSFSYNLINENILV